MDQAQGTAMGSGHTGARQGSGHCGAQGTGAGPGCSALEGLRGMWMV